MSTPREHPRRRFRALDGYESPAGSEPLPLAPETGQLADAIAAAVEWDQAAAAEPYQLDVTREYDDTTRIGNSLSAALRLELLAEGMREDVQDGRIRRDPVDGAELDPVDGLPVESEREPETVELPRVDPTTWDTPADLAAFAGLELPALRCAAAPAPEPSHYSDHLAEGGKELDDRLDQLTRAAVSQAEQLPPVVVSPERSTTFRGARARLLTWTSRHDPASLAYGVRAKLRAPAPLVDRSWDHGPILDQGTTPPLTLHDASGCTGFAGVNAANVLNLATLPPSARPEQDADVLLDGADAMRLYERAQQLDEVPGEAYPGTSVLAVMKAGQELGCWGTYLWAFGTRDVAQALLQVGPVVIGIPWLSGMATPGPDGIITVTGDDQGGHALCLHAIRMKVAGRAGPWFGALQSWGPEVGDGGVVWIHHRDLAHLLAGVGEAAIPLTEFTAMGAGL